VEIDRLYVLAVPNYMQDSAPPDDVEDEEERLAQRRRDEVAAAEKKWVDGMHGMEQAQQVASQPGYIQGIVNVVLGNLKLKVWLKFRPFSNTSPPLFAAVKGLKVQSFDFDRRSPTCISVMKTQLLIRIRPLLVASLCIASGPLLWMMLATRCLSKRLQLHFYERLPPSHALRFISIQVRHVIQFRLRTHGIRSKITNTGYLITLSPNYV
jgi:hypothetical protein